MFKIIRSLFTSPEKLLQVINRSEIEDSLAEGERIFIDEDGKATVNLQNDAVQADFMKHVNALKRA
ncbi:hypothetical protein J9874_03243 [Duffyella gerundensis]|jgi:hypothetical protein|uniref:hypothetical protein n=1 Tax=Duffyella gerundensis TaxID=1619313 RepID=UPI0016A5A6E8|nr:hypothetical protein [Duffyella gerundensis]QTO54128.1 hypothetical protein J8I88_16705 [Duffyella gerundensis]UCB32671.1 hypothetical protein J9874_03243 [Duffyella gerundensis]